MTNIVVATKNRGKQKEFERILQPLGFAVCTPQDLGYDLDIAEDGSTFLENTRKKAEETMRVCGYATIADDSGLCVDALGGAPGIYSARYSDPGATDEKNNEKLLHELDGVPLEKRGGRYVCAICCVFPDGTRIETEASCEGFIGSAPKGENGFGYDPLFYVDGRSFGEFDDLEKDQISHRGKALREFAKKLAAQKEKTDGGQR